jgi:hypothetical protein
LCSSEESEDDDEPGFRRALVVNNNDDGLLDTSDSGVGLPPRRDSDRWEKETDEAGEACCALASIEEGGSAALL